MNSAWESKKHLAWAYALEEMAMEADETYSCQE